MFVSKGTVIIQAGFHIDTLVTIFCRFGSTQEVSASFTPVTTTDQSLTWTSSHPEIVSIAKTEDGKTVLIANAIGTAEIKAMSQNGISKTVSVTVMVPAS